VIADFRHLCGKKCPSFKSLVPARALTQNFHEQPGQLLGAVKRIKDALSLHAQCHGDDDVRREKQGVLRRDRATTKIY
jgi:hypothetical protein